jgi:hypothetical protein
MPALPVYIGAILIVVFAAWCIGAPRNPAKGSE